MRLCASATSLTRRSAPSASASASSAQPLAPSRTAFSVALMAGRLRSRDSQRVWSSRQASSAPVEPRPNVPDSEPAASLSSRRPPRCAGKKPPRSAFGGVFFGDVADVDMQDVGSSPLPESSSAPDRAPAARRLASRSSPSRSSTARRWSSASAATAAAAASRPSTRSRMDRVVSGATSASTRPATSATNPPTRAPSASTAARVRAQCSAHLRTRSAGTHSASVWARASPSKTARASAGCNARRPNASRSSSKRSSASRCTSPWRRALAANAPWALDSAPPWSPRLSSAAATAADRTAARSARPRHAAARFVAGRG
mmetsp:Transcript_6957/g.22925  ORF Transcript_6957/g.22925 Transcript_6957/m.22925 type:complete len:316 (+) Transcript_6957:174-1121(+)